MTNENEDKDLFGNVIEKKKILREKFIEPPFTILDSKQGNWQRRKRTWKELGIQSEIGRESTTKGNNSFASKHGLEHQAESTQKIMDIGTISIFDPALCEVLYTWFCKKGGKILDPFAGGSVRGIVAEYLGFKYTGIDIRKEQIDSNVEQGIEILEENQQPKWIVGDANKVLDSIEEEFDFVFSCPPYGDLEIYSDLEGDISNMEYQDFLKFYTEIIDKSCKLLKQNSYACFVIGDFRDKKGNYRGFVADTIKAFQSCGMPFYNDAVYLQPTGSASMRANGQMRNQKLVKIHQNILVFKKCLN